MSFLERLSSDQLSALRRVASELVRQGQREQQKELEFLERNRDRVTPTSQATETLTEA